MVKHKITTEFFCFVLAMLFCIFCFPLDVMAYAPTMDDGSPTYDMLYTRADLTQYVNNKYSSYTNISFTDITSHQPLSTINWSQSDFNSFYYEVFGEVLSNTCAQTAITIMNEYMLRTGRVTSNPTVTGTLQHDYQYYIYKRVIDQTFLCINGWDKSGTPVDKVDDITNAVMAFCSPRYISDYSTLFIHQKYMESYYAGVPILVGLDGHRCVGAGIVEIRVSYKKAKLFGGYENCTEVETFIEVNSGNAYGQGVDNENTYAYVPFEQIQNIVVPVLD